jgi:hypothetical protein
VVPKPPRKCKEEWSVPYAGNHRSNGGFLHVILALPEDATDREALKTEALKKIPKVARRLFQASLRGSKVMKA